MMNLALALVFLTQTSADPEADAALKGFAKAYHDPSSTVRAAAVLELARTQKPAVLSKLAELLVVDDVPVRLAAAKGLSTFTESKPKAAAALISALGPNAKEFEIAAALLVALGALGDETALPTIHQHFENKDSKDKDFVVARAAIRAAGKLRRRDSIGPLVDFAKSLEKAAGLAEHGRPAKDGPGAGVSPGGASNPQTDRAQALLPAVLKALRAITQEKWPTIKEWGIWWDRHQATFTVSN
jgi:HEAT repeat protein